jgi:hypothetical protein
MDAFAHELEKEVIPFASWRIDSAESETDAVRKWHDLIVKETPYGAREPRDTVDEPYGFGRSPSRRSNAGLETPCGEFSTTEKEPAAGVEINAKRHLPKEQLLSGTYERMSRAGGIDPREELSAVPPPRHVDGALLDVEALEFVQ